jgi:hypothetical protein
VESFVTGVVNAGTHVDPRVMFSLPRVRPLPDCDEVVVLIYDEWPLHRGQALRHGAEQLIV